MPVIKYTQVQKDRVDCFNFNLYYYILNFIILLTWFMLVNHLIDFITAQKRQYINSFARFFNIQYQSLNPKMCEFKEYIEAHANGNVLIQFVAAAVGKKSVISVYFHRTKKNRNYIVTFKCHYKRSNME